MGYAVIWSPEADADFNRIAAKDVLLASHILDQIDRLATDPHGLGRPPSFPHRLLPKFQFWGPGGERRWYVTVLFQLDEARRELAVAAIGLSELY